MNPIILQGTHPAKAYDSTPKPGYEAPHWKPALVETYFAGVNPNGEIETELYREKSNVQGNEHCFNPIRVAKLKVIECP